VRKPSERQLVSERNNYASNLCTKFCLTDELWQFGAVKVKPEGQGETRAGVATSGTRAEETEMAAATAKTFSFAVNFLKFSPITIGV
jgi:hypothetical protein